MRALDLATLGELGLIEVVRRRARAPLRRGSMGIGDDAAVLRVSPGCDCVATVDALIEDVHFRWSTTDARSLGRKALAVNLSDLAAMGARPLGFLLSWGLPGSADPRALGGLLDGLLAEARASGCPLVGGDTVAAVHWMLSITALGEVKRGRALRRGGARAGDRILVTGSLGGAALGLALLERGRSDEAGGSPYVRRQLRPRARLEAGQRLSRTGLATAAIDVSDGLDRDLGHLCRASGLAAHVAVERLPLMRGLRRMSARLGLDPESLARGGGEDYELLFCVPAGAPPAPEIARRIGCAVTEIGRMQRGRGVHWMRSGAPLSPSEQGFEHFKRIPTRSDK